MYIYTVRLLLQQRFAKFCWPVPEGLCCQIKQEWRTDGRAKKSSTIATLWVGDKNIRFTYLHVIACLIVKDCLFAFLEVFVPIETTTLPVNICIFWPLLLSHDIVQWCSVSLLHIQWHVSSVFMAIFNDTYTVLSRFWQWSWQFPF